MMNTRHLLTLLAALLLAVLPAAAQVDAQYTQYWAVPSYYNPSAIGNSDYIRVTAGSRAQWVGIRHAPFTFVGSADMPFKFLNKRWGTGIILHQGSMGLYRNTNIAAQLAYKQRLFGGTLSVGLQRA